jgi:hypothetical protein
VAGGSNPAPAACSTEPTEREPDSDFEIFVMNQIQSMATRLAQVGVAGYFIDIGVRHPAWPYGFVLGVECDGASYHSAKRARPGSAPAGNSARARLAPSQDLVHRLVNNPRREGDRLRETIVSHIEELRRREFEYAAPTAGEPKMAKLGTAPAPESVVLPIFKEEPAWWPASVNKPKEQQKATAGSSARTYGDVHAEIAESPGTESQYDVAGWPSPSTVQPLSLTNTNQ